MQEKPVCLRLFAFLTLFAVVL